MQRRFVWMRLLLADEKGLEAVSSSVNGMFGKECTVFLSGGKRYSHGQHSAEWVISVVSPADVSMSEWEALGKKCFSDLGMGVNGKGFVFVGNEDTLKMLEGYEADATRVGTGRVADLRRALSGMQGCI